jgi:ribosomal protein L32
MGKPKKRTSPRASGARRSHLVLKLARVVNKKSPIKAYTTRRESGKKLSAAISPVKPATTRRVSGKKPTEVK